MKTKMLSVLFASLLLVSFGFTEKSDIISKVVKSKAPCPLIQLSGAPSTLKDFAKKDNPKSKKIKNKIVCPLITLSSPPSQLSINTGTICNNTLTVSTTTCSPFTFNFSWTSPSSGSQVNTTASGSGVCTFNLPSTITPGATISLTIDDCCGGHSNVYTFTATTKCH
jgi:hypothetical protein